jgi:DNA gyrase subunit A
MKQDDERGRLVGAFIVVEGDEVLAIKQSGQVTRSAIDENLRPTGRDTKGVRFVGVSEGDGVAQVARSVERAPEIDEAAEAAGDADVDAADREGATIDGDPAADDAAAGPGGSAGESPIDDPADRVDTNRETEET